MALEGWRTRRARAAASMSGAVLGSILLAPSMSWAQSTSVSATATAASASPAALSAEERAKRDGDKVFKWILIHSDKPRRPKPDDEKPVAATARPKPARAASKVDDQAAEPATTAAVARTPPLPAAADRPAAGPSRSARTTGGVSASPPPEQVAPNQPAPVDVASIVPQSRTETPSAAPPTSPAAIAAQAIDDVLTPVYRADPQFPQSLLRTLRKGQVQVRFTVLPDGNVATPAVVKTTNPRLNEAALAAVGQWRFVPIRRAQEGVVDLAFDID